jgi:hypothetical protein
MQIASRVGRFTPRFLTVIVFFFAVVFDVVIDFHVITAVIFHAIIIGMLHSVDWALPLE